MQDIHPKRILNQIYLNFLPCPEQIFDTILTAELSLAFVRGIHQSPVNSLHEGPVTRKMFPFDDVIMIATVPETQVRLRNTVWGR